MAANHWFCPSKLFNIQFVKKIENQENSWKRLFQDSTLVYNGISFGIFLFVCLFVCLLHYQYFLKSLASIICSVVFGNTTKPHSLFFSLSSLFLLCSFTFYFLFSSNWILGCFSHHKFERLKCLKCCGILEQLPVLPSAHTEANHLIETS